MRDRLDSLKECISGQVENFVLFDTTDSTHALATKIIAGMDDESQHLGATLILANRQDQGQGRGERTWESPEGGLYMSWLRSGIKATTIAQLPMLAAVAAHDAISHIGVPNARIKWPNDILVDGRKIAGILVYARHGESSWVTVGLGVNLLTAPDLGDANAVQATSVAELVELGDVESWRHDIVCNFINRLENLMKDPERGIEGWRDLLIQSPGDTVDVRLGSGSMVSGTIVEITEEGFLKIRENGNERVITGGDIIES